MTRLYLPWSCIDRDDSESYGNLGSLTLRKASCFSCGLDLVRVCFLWVAWLQYNTDAYEGDKKTTSNINLFLPSLYVLGDFLKRYYG